MREIGSIWAKIVRKDLQKPENEANWRKVFRFPGPIWGDSLPFDSFTKKLKIKRENTRDCRNGCFILMTIQINDIGSYFSENIFYFFSILIRVAPYEKSDIWYAPRVVIQIDEFIIGSFNTSEIDYNYIAEFYEIWLQYDSDQVEFDWQSSTLGLYIIIDDGEYISKKADFFFYSTSKDSVFVLEKKDILEKAKNKGIIGKDVDSIQDIKLLIGIWTNKTEPTEYELYSLRVHQRFKSNSSDNLDIIEVKNDQKIVCKTKPTKLGYDGVYNCIFMISFNGDNSIDSPIYIHGYSTNSSADVYLYGSSINIELYKSYNISELKKLVPTSENAEYNTFYDDINYIYISNLSYNKALLVNIYSHYEDDLILINSMPIHNNIGNSKIEVANPYTGKLFVCTNEILQVSLPGNEGISADIKVLNGEAEISWPNEVDIFTLKDENDKLTLLSDSKERKIKIRNLNFNKNEIEAKIEDPGFLFYLEFNARVNGFNLDEINFGKSTELAYQNTDLPIVLYCKIGGGKIYKDLNIAILFKDNLDKDSGEYKESPIIIQAIIIKEQTLYDIKKSKDINIIPSEEKSILGNYYPSIKTAFIYMSKAQIDSFNIKESENPILYLYLKKSNNYTNITNNKLNIEVQVAGINDGIIPIENNYHYGKLGENQNEVFYVLKIHKDKYFVKIEIAFNSNDLDFTLNHLKNKRENQTYDNYNSYKEKGKIIITFKLSNIFVFYLNFFRKNGVKSNRKLSNYVFKYMSAKYEQDFYNYTIKNDNLIIIKNTYSTIINFNPINFDRKNMIITYFLKIIKNTDYITREYMNTIAITESPSLIKYERNPSFTEKNNINYISFEVEGQSKDWKNINIIAQIKEQNIIEYIAYNGLILTIEIYIKSLREEINIGQNRVIILETEYNDNDNEVNIFNINDIQLMTEFKGIFSGIDKNYEANCRLWKPKCENIRIICKFNTDIISGKYKFQESLINYKEQAIILLSKSDININKLDLNLAVLYSDQQELNITDKDYYTLNFRKEAYNKEYLLLYNNRMKNIILDCSEETEFVKCKFEKKKILEILSYSGEKYYLYQWIKSIGYLRLDNVFDISLNYDISTKINIHLDITKLLTPFIDKNTFVVYETNITKIQRIITDNFKIISNNNKEYKLFFLCNGDFQGAFSLGIIEEQYLSNIHALYNFIISKIINNEICIISEKDGTIIFSVYPYLLDFNKKDSFIIEYQTDNPERFNKIKLNNYSSSELKCENKKGIKECLVPYNHFTKSGNYYTYYYTNFDHEIIAYEISTINVILKKENSGDNNFEMIIGSIVGVTVIVIVIIVLFWRCRKKVKDNKDENNEKGENLQILYPGCEEENKNSVN